MSGIISLKKNSDFQRLYKRGKSFVTPTLVVYAMKNKRVSRLGITAGKKVGGAVQRNRAKRIIRAAYRKNELLLPIGYDIVIVARPEINGKKSDWLDRFYQRLAAQIKNSV